MRLGMTTVTFRTMNMEALLDLAIQAGLDGLEWGGDVHVPPDQVALAKQVRARCADAGIAVLSYGSYYRGEKQGFDAVLRSAVALGAPIIRVWAGSRAPSQMGQEDVRILEANLKEAVRLAKSEGIGVSLEYHRNTMTERADAACCLLDAVPGLCAYWQPNPDLEVDEHLRELQALGERLSNLHVFTWGAGNVRHPLADGARDWARYLQAVRAIGGSHDLILEFVKGDAPAQLLMDAETLAQWTRA